MSLLTTGRSSSVGKTDLSSWKSHVVACGLVIWAETGDERPGRSDRNACILICIVATMGEDACC